MPTTMYNPLQAAGYQSITATSGTAVGFTIAAASAASAARPDPNYAYIVCKAVSARWRDDGTDPAADTGVPLPANTPFVYEGNVRSIKFFTDPGAQTIIYASLYRAGP